MGSHLIAGRDVTWTETYNQTPVALVSENMAHELWRDSRAALGKRIRLTPDENGGRLSASWPTSATMASSVQRRQSCTGLCCKSTRAEPNPSCMAALPQRAPHPGFHNPHAPRRTLTLLQDLGRAVAAVNPSLPVADVNTLESIYDRSLARTTFTMVLLAIAGAMAFLLGVVGIYGVISYAVSQRTANRNPACARRATSRPHPDVLALRSAPVGHRRGVWPDSRVRAVTPHEGVLYEVSPIDPLTYGECRRADPRGKRWPVICRTKSRQSRPRPNPPRE